MFPFDRLVRTVDDWAATRGYTDVLAQIGEGAYTPANTRWVRMMRPAEFGEAIASAELVVAHLGMGSIVAARQAHRPLFVFPRALALGEHTSDHQLDATDWLRSLPGVWVALDAPALHRLLDEFLDGKIFQPTDAGSPYAAPELIEHVRGFIKAGLAGHGPAAASAVDAARR